MSENQQRTMAERFQQLKPRGYHDFIRLVVEYKCKFKSSINDELTIFFPDGSSIWISEDTKLVETIPPPCRFC